MLLSQRHGKPDATHTAHLSEGYGSLTPRVPFRCGYRLPRERVYPYANASEILDVSDGLMVARGDLGVEIPLEKIPPTQKKLISLCNVKRKMCVVATEMLESMTHSTRPTRAEVNDVANAIYEEASATMLSGETASGINPVLVVQTMTKIILEVEKHIYKMKTL